MEVDRSFLLLIGRWSSAKTLSQYSGTWGGCGDAILLRVREKERMGSRELLEHPFDLRAQLLRDDTLRVVGMDVVPDGPLGAHAGRRYRRGAAEGR